jgi:hypothetical protein
MQKFLYYLFTMLLIVVVGAFVLEQVYNFAFYKGYPRSKIALAKANTKSDTLDFALFGSSRCQNTLNPVWIKQRTGKTGINMGTAAQGPLEVLLMVSEFLKTGYAKKIFVQVDGTYNRITPNPLGETTWLPYIKEPEIYAAFAPLNRKYFWYKHLPMLRYLTHESVIGFREVMLCFIKASEVMLNSGGFYGVPGPFVSIKKEPYQLIDQDNPAYTKLIALCRDKGVDLNFFTAPIYKQRVNNTVIKKRLPKYSDFSTAISDSTLFRDYLHVANEGAKVFSRLFADSCLR